jgi:hypothetical protein
VLPPSFESIVIAAVQPSITNAVAGAAAGANRGKGSVAEATSTKERGARPAFTVIVDAATPAAASNAMATGMSMFASMEEESTKLVTSYTIRSRPPEKDARGAIPPSSDVVAASAEIGPASSVKGLAEIARTRLLLASRPCS